MDNDSINQQIRSRKGGLAILIIAGIFMYSALFLCSTNEEKYNSDTIVEHILQQIEDDAGSYSEDYPHIDSELLLQAWQDGMWHSEWDSVRKRWAVNCSYEYDDSMYISRWLTLDDGNIVETEFFITE